MFKKKIKTIIKIDGMSCIHCANKVKTTLLKIDNIKKVKVDLAKKEATIISNEKLDINKIKEKIEQLDYKVIDIMEINV